METAIGIIFAIGVLAFMGWAVYQAYKRAKAQREKNLSGSGGIAGGSSSTGSRRPDRTT